MQWLKNRKHRFFISILAAMAAAVLAAGLPTGLSARTENPRLTAWWGTMYPEFCFARPAQKEGGQGGGAAGKVKISFWLAKALNW